jgi:hypothetical protein
MVQKRQSLDISYKLKLIKGYKSGRNSQNRARAALRALMRPWASTVLRRSRLDAGLVLKPGLESQEGNRSPGLYSRIYMYGTYFYHW